MVRRRKREGKVPRTLTDFKVVFEPVILSEELNNERIKRLAKQILECVERTKRRCAKLRDRTNLTDTFFEEDYDKIFGLV